MEDEVPAANQAVDATRGEILRHQPMESRSKRFFIRPAAGVRKSRNMSGRHASPAMILPVHQRQLLQRRSFLPLASGCQRRSDRLFALGCAAPASAWAISAKIKGLKPVSVRPGLGRVSDLFVYTTERRNFGQNFRMAHRPGSSAQHADLTDISRTSGTEFRFEGHGWGHGVGLCQWGARGRAQAGQTYKDILKAYYPTRRSWCRFG